MLGQLFDEVSGTPWDDLTAVDEVNRRLLAALDEDRGLLRKLIEAAAGTPELAALCEHFATKDKVVLHAHPSGWRLRMHVFPAGYRDEPHDHRWNFTTRIVHGEYTHTLYERPDAEQTVDLRTLPVRVVRRERSGDSYTLQHTAFHTVAADTLTVSLLVRGPSVKRTSVVTDPKTGQANPYFGARQEQESTRRNKRMAPERMQSLMVSLVDAGMLP